MTEDSKEKKIRHGETRGVIRHLPRLLIWSVLLICLIPFLLIFILHLPRVQTHLLTHAIRYIEKNIAPIHIQVERFEWKPFSLFRLHHLEITSAEERILRSDKAELSYYLSWSWPYLHPVEMFLEKPFLRLEKDDTGHWNIPNVKGPPKEASSDEPPLWTEFPWPRVRLSSAMILAYQNGRSILSIRDVNGTFSLQAVKGPKGPSLRINLGYWEGHADTPAWGKWRLSGKGKIEEQTLLLDQFTLGIAGRTRLSALGRWSLAPPYEGSVTLQLDPLIWASFPELPQQFPYLEHVSGELHLAVHENRWSLGHDLQSDRGSLKGTMEIDHPESKDRLIRWSAHLGEVRIPDVNRIPGPLLNGSVELALRGDTLRNLKAQLSGRLESSTWVNTVIQKADFSGSYDLGTCTLTMADVQSALGLFSLSAVADLRGLWDEKHAGGAEIKLDVAEGNLKEVFAATRQQVKGNVHLQGSHGPGEARQWQLWQGKLNVDLNAPGFLSLKASGAFENESLDITYDLNVADLQRFAEFVPSWEGKGNVKSVGSIKGKWPEWIWEGNLQAGHLQHGPFRTGRATITGKGDIPGKNGRRELILKAGNVTLRDMTIPSLELDLNQRDDTCRFRIKGDRILKIRSAQLTGQLKNMWDPERLLILDQGEAVWNNRKFSLNGELELDIEKNRITSRSFTVTQGTQRVQCTGNFFLDEKNDVRITWDNVVPEQWLRAFGQQEHLTGTAEGAVHLTGRLEQPQLAFDLRLKKGTLATKEPFDRIELTGKYAESRLQLQGELHAPQTRDPVLFSAGLPFHLSLRPFQGELKRKGDLFASVRAPALHATSLSPYLPFVDRLKGTIMLDGKVHGSLDRPQVEGTGFWRDGHLRFKAWPHLIENIQLEVKADSEKIQIKSENLHLLDGTVNLRGSARYSHLGDIVLEATGKGLKIPEFYGIRAKASGHAQLSRLLDGPQLVGQFKVLKGEMDLGDLESDLAKDIEVVEAEDKGVHLEVHEDKRSKRDFYDGLRMDLKVELPPSGTWVRGKGIKAETIGALNIKKAESGPLKLLGKLQTTRGVYRFQDNELKIVEGELIFSGLPEPDPDLKIVGEKQVKDVIVQVQITGPASRPKLTLSSIPALEQVDILSYLVFGRPAGELNSRETAGLQQRAVFWIGSRASRVLKKVLGDAPFAPDILELRNTEDGGIIEVGKELTPELSVTYEKGLAGKEEDQVQLEYRLNRHLSVQSKVGREDQAGVDILFRYDF